MVTIINRIAGRLRKIQFAKRFKQLSVYSGIGSNGVGKGCKLIGTQYISIGEECYFGEGTELIAIDHHFDQILNPELSIGNHVRCVGGCRISYAGNVILENDTLIGLDVYITDHNHGMDPTIRGGYSRQPLIIKKVLIKEGVWLGKSVSVLPGVTIGEHSIIGANSVVTHDIAPYSIAAGSPAIERKQWDHKTKEWIPISNSIIK